MGTHTIHQNETAKLDHTSLSPWDPAVDYNGKIMFLGDLITPVTLRDSHQKLDACSIIFLGKRDDDHFWIAFGPNGIEKIMFSEDWVVVKEFKECEDITC